MEGVYVAGYRYLVIYRDANRHVLPVKFAPNVNNLCYDWLLLRNLENISQCFCLQNSGLNSNLEGVYVAGYRYLVIYRDANRHVLPVKFAPNVNNLCYDWLLLRNLENISQCFCLQISGLNSNLEGVYEAGYRYLVIYRDANRHVLPVKFAPNVNNLCYDWLLLRNLENISQCFCLQNSGLNSNLEGVYVAGYRYLVIYRDAYRHVLPVKFAPNVNNFCYDWLLLRNLENISQCFCLQNSGLNSNLEGVYVAGYRYLVIYRDANRHVLPVKFAPNVNNLCYDWLLLRNLENISQCFCLQISGLNSNLEGVYEAGYRYLVIYRDANRHVVR